jgi:hypothetical protein
MTGITRSDATQRKMRDAHLGRRPSEATRSKMRIAALARWAREREFASLGLLNSNSQLGVGTTSATAEEV